MDDKEAPRKAKKRKLQSLYQVLSDYCANTTGHGFQYWFSAETILERALWVSVVFLGLLGGLVMVSAALKQWSDNPDTVTIKTFSKPAREVPYPAITICKQNGYNVGEYIRAVFDNFEFSCESGSDECEKSRLLRADFPGFSNASGGAVSTMLAQLLAFPVEAKQTFWGKKEEYNNLEVASCMARMRSLMPYYFIPNATWQGDLIGNLAEGLTYKHLFGNLIAGFDNSKEWEEMMDVHFGGCPDPYKMGTASAPEDCIKTTFFSRSNATSDHATDCRLFENCPRVLPRRLKELLKAGNENPQLFKDLASCIETVTETDDYDYVTVIGTDINNECLKPHRESLGVSAYDAFLLKRITNGTDEPVTEAKLIAVFSETNVTQIYYQEIDSAMAYEDDLARLFAKIIFLIDGSRLPEGDFGKILAKQGLNMDGDISHSGMSVMLKAVFGEEQLPEANTLCAHPIMWQALFSPNPKPLWVWEEIMQDIAKLLPRTFTIEALSKLLMYGNYAKAKAEAQSTTVGEIVMRELELYPYTKKTDTVNPYFTPTDLKRTYPEVNFRAAITDAGICQVYNGESLHSTIRESERNTQLRQSLDPRTAGKEPKLINGTGVLAQRTFWLDAGPRPMFEREEPAHLMVAINEWTDYFNVRINQLDVRAGTEVILKVRPTQHSTSEGFKSLTLEERRCRFKHENEDPNSVFRIYSEEGCLFECRLRNASSHTNCIPWDYPVPQDLDGIDICLGWQNGTNNMKKFNAIMDDPEVINTCNCLPDCEHITYETQVDTYELDKERCHWKENKKMENIMNNGNPMANMVLEDWRKTNSPFWNYWGEFLRNPQAPSKITDATKNYVLPLERCQDSQNLEFGLPVEDAKAVCEEKYAKEVVKLTIQIVDPNIKVIEKDVSATFNDKLGVVGGTIGLFTGLSLISFVEIIYWAIKLLINLVRRIQMH